MKNKKINKADMFASLIRMCREFDTKKNTPAQTSAFLNFMAHELELILGGYYE
jgi:hypothetical protein